MSTTGVPGPDPYAFATDRDEEERRLLVQAQLFETMTEEMLRQAGLGPGMRVIDLGSGPGDMAMLAARLVGPGGSVLGVERAPEQVVTARKRVAGLGIDNVMFREGDVAAIAEVLAEHPGPVDAVIGRCIYMWVPGRGEVLRTLAEKLPPGALVFALEPDTTYDFALPAGPLWQQMQQRWFLAALEGLGAERRMGPRLYHAFVEAGLPAPTLETRSIMRGPADAPLWFWVNIIRAIQPVLAELGLATADELGIDTLEDRLRAELVAHNAVGIVPPMTGAWSRIPG
ncbi:MAG TPA: methyltransferase domain-containing protein [Acidimicrobiia bacterium]|nr:methyltransferase domain-containing protein [Acidimicrobiia bacterium]